LPQEKEMLAGQVERITYRNEQNGWTVMDLAVDKEIHKVVGILPLCNAGDRVQLLGHWGSHPTFGARFEAESYERKQPVGADAILRYLAAGSIKGIGPATAAAIVDKFGDDTLRILEEEPEKLALVRGISRRRAEEIGRFYAEQFGLREVMLTFSRYQLTPHEALRCWKRWGAATLDRIKENPYLLCSSGLRIGFERADALCMALGGDAESPARVGAGIVFVLRHNMQNGHTCLPADKLVPAVAQMLQVELPLTERILDELISAQDLRERYIDERRFVFLPAVYQAEQYAAMRICRMASAGEEVSNKTLDRRIDRLEKQDKIIYAPRQREAIKAALTGQTLVLTGGPGTGKTTTLKAIITLLEKAGKKVLLAAPTGRAAKRMEELTGREAKTLHRLLEVQWDEDDTPFFARNENEPLDVDVLVIDEMSMVDSLLFESVLRALRLHSRLILVGDVEQLPAVGIGCVLQDLIRSGAVPVVQLTEIFRQAMSSRIVTNAHRIVNGEMPQADNQKDSDCFFMPRRTERDTAQTVVELCATRLPAKYGQSVFDGIQVLCPGRKGGVGTKELNRLLQETINPPSPDREEITVEGGTLLRVGDKVMHTRNNYDIPWTKDDDEVGSGVFNGDIGRLEAIDRREETLTVRYDDRVALYTREDAADLELAYAATVHKSQGSEFDIVVLPLFRTMPLLCYRNLLYTAVTRAKTLLVLVGDWQTVAAMVKNDRRVLRFSALWHFLQEGESAE